jgi:hypothetical protein
MWKKWLAFSGMLALVILLDPTHTPAQPFGGKGGKGGKGDRPRDGGSGGPGSSSGMNPGGPGSGYGGPGSGFGGPGSGGPGSGFGRGFGGPGSGFGGPGSGFGGPGSGFGGPGSGGPGGPGSGFGGPGGGRSRSVDPETGWKMLSNMTGGDGQTVDLSKIPPQTQAILKNLAERSGSLALPESGVMTRSQYFDFHARSEQSRAAFSAANGGPGGNPMGSGQGGWGQGGWGQGGFGQSGWGQGQGGWAQGGWGQGQGGEGRGFERRQSDEERPVAMRYGKLPRGLPKWYHENDTDKDGQVSLYEWRKAGSKTDEFTEMDLNGDGLVTADEYLRFARMRNIEIKVAEYEAGERDPGNWGLGEKLGTDNTKGPNPRGGWGQGGFGQGQGGWGQGGWGQGQGGPGSGFGPGGPKGENKGDNKGEGKSKRSEGWQGMFKRN